MNKAQPTIELIGLKKNYGDTPILKGIDLRAYPTDIICILGSSGAGKSTLLRCINLLEIPDEGEVRINGATVEMATDRKNQRRPTNPEQVAKIRCNLGMVFQQFNLWSHMRVEQNITLGLRKALKMDKKSAKDKAYVALEQVGMQSFGDKFPAQLSGGQQQRVAIARVLAMDPDAILFDEPTSSLDPELVSDVLKLIASLATSNRTMLIVTHEVSFAEQIATQIIFLDQGLVHQSGSSEYFFRECQSPLVQKFLAKA